MLTSDSTGGENHCTILFITNGSPPYISPTSFFNEHSYCIPLMILTKVPQLLTMKSTSAQGYLKKEAKGPATLDSQSSYT